MWWGAVVDVVVDEDVDGMAVPLETFRSTSPTFQSCKRTSVNLHGKSWEETLIVRMVSMTFRKSALP